jgi:hypothetical protein
MLTRSIVKGSESRAGRIPRLANSARSATGSASVYRSERSIELVEGVDERGLAAFVREGSNDHPAG